MLNESSKTKRMRVFCGVGCAKAELKIIKEKLKRKKRNKTFDF